MTTQTNHPSNNTHTADVPSAPPETHQRASVETSHQSSFSELASHDSESLDLRITAAEREAYRGCGLSDELYEARVQRAYMTILAQAPDAERATTEATLRAHGFDPNFKPYEPEPNECSLTGIDVCCCPCGCHP